MSKKLKLSQWHDGSVLPVHVGVYERKYSEINPAYSRWDGKQWHCATDNVKDSSEMDCSSLGQRLKWRGIVK